MLQTILISCCIAALIVSTISLVVGIAGLALAIGITRSTHTVQYEPLGNTFKDMLPFGKKDSEESSPPESPDPFERMQQFKEQELEDVKKRKATNLLMSNQHLFQPIKPQGEADE
jgi:hypothetical protein